MNPSVSDSSQQPTALLQAHIKNQIEAAGGWLPFDAFMHSALYAPSLGYYAGGLQKFGALPSSGSDFITAPELSPLFGHCVAEQAAQILQATGTQRVYEFGAGSGALALQICEHLAHTGRALERYFIIELSAELRARQQARLAHLGDQVQWLDALPDAMQGVVVGNEVLDAMPIKLLFRQQGVWHERGVTHDGAGFQWCDRITTLRPPLEIAGEHDYLSEIHPQAEAFMRSVAERLSLGAALFIDYGFPEAEYYHPQRHMGTLMCHRLHLSDPDPLVDVGLKDITSHVNFTGIALAAQSDQADGGLDLLGYTSQGRFLLNCGLLQKSELSAHIPRALAADLTANTIARLINEHEMGELFKVLALGRGVDVPLIGFAQGDRSHTL